MPAKIDENILTLRDAEILHSQLQGDTLDETAEAVGCSRDSVKRAKKKQAYRDTVLQLLEDKKYTVSQQVDNIIELTQATKSINVGGEEVDVKDNTTRFNTIKLLSDIYGLSAPKEIDIKHSTQGLTSEELLQELIISEQAIKGHGGLIDTTTEAASS